MTRFETSAMDLPGTSCATGNVLPLLHEIRHAVTKLLGTGEETIIDLRSIPLGPGEDERIEQALGTGEVRAELDAIGPSTIVETAFPGVWLVTHRNSDSELVGRFIEITRVPAILQSQTRDVEAGQLRLEQLLATGGHDPTPDPDTGDPKCEKT